MNWLKFVAILLVVDAIIILIRPDFIKHLAGMLAQGAKIYIASLAKAALGIIFLFGAGSKSTLPWVIIIFGVLALAGGILIIAVPQKARSMANWFTHRSFFTLRCFAAGYLVIAALLVYAA
ncbi:MAG: hypothetical protein A2Y12_06420 [Planctomycetes bacterium GWF2_42_9]|nr:MAG: hypothetical protein A2Y12_06420 [Planctomycetes bacterium GWF2_42_9]HAL45292.1 hypothetical protein [Phycisphaerales bacterium]